MAPGSTNSRVLAGISRVISRSVTGSIQPPSPRFCAGGARWGTRGGAARVFGRWSRSGWRRRIRKGWPKRGWKERGRYPTVYVGESWIRRRLRDPRRTQSIDSDVGGSLATSIDRHHIGKGQGDQPICSRPSLLSALFAGYPFSRFLIQSVCSRHVRLRARSLSRLNRSIMTAALCELVSRIMISLCYLLIKPDSRLRATCNNHKTRTSVCKHARDMTYSHFITT